MPPQVENLEIKYQEDKDYIKYIQDFFLISRNSIYQEQLFSSKVAFLFFS